MLTASSSSDHRSRAGIEDENDDEHVETYSENAARRACVPASRCRKHSAAFGRNPSAVLLIDCLHEGCDEDYDQDYDRDYEKHTRDAQLLRSKSPIVVFVAPFPGQTTEIAIRITTKTA